MKKQTRTETLAKLEPFTDDEIAVLKKAINTFSSGGHPMPTESNITGFEKNWVCGLLKKAKRMLETVAKSPADERDLKTLKQLLERFNKK